MSDLALPARRRGPGRPFPPGVSGNPGGSPGRARQALNADTIREMHFAFKRGGRKAIDKVMKNNPAVFLKLLVLLVPRELTVEHKGGVKAMTDEQLEAGIEAIQAMLEARGESAKVVEGVEVIPPRNPRETPAKPVSRGRRKVRKSERVADPALPNDDDQSNSINDNNGLGSETT